MHNMTNKDNKMVHQFREYLQENLMNYKELTPYVYEIGGKTFEIFQPVMQDTGNGEQPVLFDDFFNFCGIPLEPNAERMDTDCDYIAYRFGGVWYMLDKDKKEDVKLCRLKYIGSAVPQAMPMDVFLGVHGQYEILSGSGTYADWVAKAKFLGVKALGICERDTLAGALKFQAECDKGGIKPIIGMECSVYDIKNEVQFTVKVYVKTVKGWDILLSINKAINCDYPKYIPLDEFKALIKGQYDNLLIILDPKTLLHSDLVKMDLVGDDVGYVQIDSVKYNEEFRDKEYLTSLKEYFNDPMLAPFLMVDAWYLDKEYSCIRKRLSAISGKNFFDSDNQYFKTNDQVITEIETFFPMNEDGAMALDLLDKSLESLRYEVDSITFRIETNNRHLPKYKMLPEESEKYGTNEELFDGLIEDGLRRHPELIERWGESVIRERIQREKGVIELGAAIDYFLITRDIINWCHKNDIMTGVSRGSAGGCLVSYLLGITKLDPLEYNLLFERFLNEGRVRVTLPDIDTDFPGQDRPRVKAYMEERYGKNQVCSVGTFSALQLRAAIKDMARVYGMEFQKVNDMMDAFSVSDRKPEDLFKIACGERGVKKFVLENPQLINEVMLVMPAPKAQSIHACATMIFPDDKDMFHWVPIRKQGDEYVSEWEGGEMDAAGFLKNDILGVKQLDKFQDIVRLIKENSGDDVDIFNIPLDDEEVYRFFCKGWNEDTFHFGSKGLTGYCKQMKPKNMEELISAISLYRPGAMENGFHEEYVKLKAGFEACGKRRNIHTSPEEDRRNAGMNIEYFKGTENILSNTYGVFCYQEQIMELCKQLGGLSLVEADDVRKAMVKKKYEALGQYRERFIPYYMENYGVDKEYAEEVWDAIDKASTYLFNRSHAAAYAITGYISQWLKVHYPVEYWSVAFKYAETTDYPQYIAEIRAAGTCDIKSVDINYSTMGVTVKDGKLYWSLLGVKQVAEKAATQILQVRERCDCKQYFSFNDFVQMNKMKGSAVNSRVIKNLILAGAFDNIEGIKDAQGRMELYCRYAEESKSKSSDVDALVGMAKINAKNEWWWQLLQRQSSGIAFFNYKKLSEALCDNTNYPYYDLEDNNGMEGVPTNGKVSICGVVVDVIKKSVAKKGTKDTDKGAEKVRENNKRDRFMHRFIIEQNYHFIEVVSFANESEILELAYGDQLTKLKGSLVCINGECFFDSRKQDRALRCNTETEITTLELGI